KLAKSSSIQQLLAATVAPTAGSPAASRLALAAMAASGLKELPAAWVAALQDLLVGNSALISDALATIRAVPPAKANAEQIAAALLRLGDSPAPPETRLSALALVPGGAKNVTAGQFDLLLASIDREQPSNL